MKESVKCKVRMNENERFFLREKVNDILREREREREREQYRARVR